MINKEKSYQKQSEAENITDDATENQKMLCLLLTENRGINLETIDRI